MVCGEVRERLAVARLEGPWTRTAVRVFEKLSPETISGEDQPLMRRS